MGIGFDFGPPRVEGFDPDGDWRGERRLTPAQLADLGRHVESWGYEVETTASGQSFIQVPCEAFMFAADGGYLSKPGAGSARDRDDEFEEQISLAERVCDFAGWVMIGEGYEYGFRRSEEGYAFTTAPPAPDLPDPGLRDRLTDVSTSAALREVLGAYEKANEPLPQPEGFIALLVSADEALVARGLAGLEAMPSLPESAVLGARLRRVALLCSDPELVARATSLGKLLR